MKKESDAILLRIFIGESDKHEGKPLSQYLVQFFKKEGLAGATVLRGMSGFGKSSKLHTASILRLSDDLPVVVSASILRLSDDLPVVVEVVDRKENIERIKPKLDDVIKEGLITEEEVKIILYESSTPR